MMPIWHMAGLINMTYVKVILVITLLGVMLISVNNFSSPSTNLGKALSKSEKEKIEPTHNTDLMLLM
jgi:hypothetical protein